jgi:hypothetical protein
LQDKTSATTPIQITSLLEIQSPLLQTNVIIAKSSTPPLQTTEMVCNTPELAEPQQDSIQNKSLLEKEDSTMHNDKG